MEIGWAELTFTPSDDAVLELENSWGWLLREPFKPLLFSILGDVFFQLDSGGVWRLNAGTAEVTRVAESVDEFRRLLTSDFHDEWLLPDLVEKLHISGKVPLDGQCYTYVTLPIFKEGKYVVENLNCVAAQAHFKLTGYMHQEIQDLPNGAKVRIVVS